MSRLFLILLLWVFAPITEAVDAPVAAPLQDPHESAVQQLQKSLKMFYETLEDKDESGAYEAARAVFESFFHSAFSYDVPPKGVIALKHHQKFLKMMQTQFEDALKLRGDTISIDELRILLKALDDVVLEADRTDTHQESRRIGSIGYTTLGVMAGDLIIMKGGRAGLNKWRNRGRMPTALPPEPDVSRPPQPTGFSAKRLCAVMLARSWRFAGNVMGSIKRAGLSTTRAVGWFLLRDSAIGGGVSLISYPLYFKRFEPYQASDDVVKKKLRRFILDEIRKRDAKTAVQQNVAVPHCLLCNTRHYLP